MMIIWVVFSWGKVNGYWIWLRKELSMVGRMEGFVVFWRWDLKEKFGNVREIDFSRVKKYIGRDLVFWYMCLWVIFILELFWKGIEMCLFYFCDFFKVEVSFYVRSIIGRLIFKNFIVKYLSDCFMVFFCFLLFI